ncbi:MAG: hypothetical protein ACREV5_17305 [Steroidobacter sp.]
MQSTKQRPSLRLKAIAEADPGALVRILQLLQGRNLVPRAVNAECIGAQYLDIRIELDGSALAADAAKALIAKIEQLPAVLAIVDCDG